MTGLSITVNVSQNIVGSDGFGFQVNAYSAKKEYDGGQQYLIYLDPHSSPAQLYCMVDNWTEVPGPKLDQIINLTSPIGHSTEPGTPPDISSRFPCRTTPAGRPLARTTSSSTIRGRQ